MSMSGAVSPPSADVAAQWPIIVNLLAGSLAGTWLGASSATRLSSTAVYCVIAVMLVGIAAVLVLGHHAAASGAMLTGLSQAVVGIGAGFGIGIVAAVLGLAGGELLIWTLIQLFGADIKLAASLSLAVSLPTMLIGFARHAQDRSFVLLAKNQASCRSYSDRHDRGAFIGGPLSGLVTSSVLKPLLVAALLGLAVKIWRHQ